MKSRHVAGTITKKKKSKFLPLLFVFLPLSHDVNTIGLWVFPSIFWGFEKATNSTTLINDKRLIKLSSLS